jgi:hypothetical protein
LSEAVKRVRSPSRSPAVVDRQSLPVINEAAGDAKNTTAPPTPSLADPVQRGQPPHDFALNTGR